MTEKHHESRFPVWKAKVLRPGRFRSNLDCRTDLFSYGCLPWVEFFPEAGISVGINSSGFLRHDAAVTLLFWCVTIWDVLNNQSILSSKRLVILEQGRYKCDHFVNDIILTHTHILLPMTNIQRRMRYNTLVYLNILLNQDDTPFQYFIEFSNWWLDKLLRVSTGAMFENHKYPLYSCRVSTYVVADISVDQDFACELWRFTVLHAGLVSDCINCLMIHIKGIQNSIITVLKCVKSSVFSSVSWVTIRPLTSGMPR
jgi:hypothetical protein